MGYHDHFGSFNAPSAAENILSDPTIPDRTRYGALRKTSANGNLQAIKLVDLEKARMSGAKRDGGKPGMKRDVDATGHRRASGGRIREPENPRLLPRKFDNWILGKNPTFSSGNISGTRLLQMELSPPHKQAPRMRLAPTSPTFAPPTDAQ
ncbi:hypothetical protein BBK36DRAFT_1163808 [Trichoderma citrinoviride]|uniref:Uncharacterized protein n=1 Tax=Trichoderma citrinoviride TaxID=58853 RepID=A0A2T4AX10_9HYPO|nr:hypothetical protein BBK36DRAFT_1163808 [Trichoderma citrinoviride]PTB61610.1 hypothetical protein BBK36DRAFT_1163808 [Trichoderma citrinoviride]